MLVGGLWPRKASVRRGARWDGIMTHFPGDGVLPADGTAPEIHAEQLICDQPGDVFLPAHPDGASGGWADFAVEQLGATWLYTAKIDGRWTLDIERISQGPAPV